MGPVAPGDKLLWMRVWVWQQDEGHLAASSGTSGVHLGGHGRDEKEDLPFLPDKGWMIQTELEKHSQQFVEGKPALAMAMAIVEHDRDNSRDVETWSQAVMVGRPPAQPGSGHEPPRTTSGA